MKVLKALRKEKQKTQTQMAEMIGLTQQAYAAYENDVAQPPLDVVNKLAEYFGVSVDYLLGRSVTAQLPPYSNIYPLDAPIRLPIYGEIRAGEPIFTDQGEFGEWIYEDKIYGDENHFVLRVVGDSMSPEIRNGSLAIIRHQNYAEKGQIVACCLDGDFATLKRYFPQPDGSILFKADNPEAMSYTVTKEQLRTGYAHIIGVVREIKRKYY